MKGEEYAVETIKAHMPSFLAAYHFGTSGTKHERPDSDVDLALLLPPGKHPLELLRQGLEEALGRSVDLIDLRTAPTILQKEVVITGRRIACTNELETELFETRVLGAYQKLSQEREEIVTAGLESGRFYGP